MDTSGINVMSLFDGISGGQLALDELGVKVNDYYSSEINKNAIAITSRNFPNTIQLGSVLGVDGNKYRSIDLLLGGSPCQGFSFGGDQLNFNDPRSKLFFEYVRILREVNPRYFLLENTPMKKEYQDIISQYLGVEPIEINSSLLSAQNRKRLYWTNIPVDKPSDKNIQLSSIIGDYEGIWVYPRGFNKGGVQWYKGKSPTITISSWQHNFFVKLKEGKRKFTVEEVELLQTLPVGYTYGVSDNQRYKACGNGWTIAVIKHILKELVTKEEV